MEKRTLKYFLDNKNFARVQKHPKKKESVLQVVDDQIVMGLDASELFEEEIVTSYTYMRNKGNRKRWNKEENDRFYSALECCGLDFSIMNILFPDRTRGNLKDKYKRESKTNTHKIEDALNSYKGFNVEKFEDLKLSLRKPSCRPGEVGR